MRMAAIACAMVALLAAPRADACTPIRYELTGITADSLAADLVAQSDTIQLMRVVRRREASMVRMHEMYGDATYGQIYLYDLVPVSTLKGFDSRPLLLHAFARGRIWPRAPYQLPRTPLWWLTPDRFQMMEDAVVPDPEDPGVLACSWPIELEIGEERLVFRDDRGALIVSKVWRPNTLRQPVFEPIASDDDPWLRAVRDAVATRAARHGFWDGVFELAYGRTKRESLLPD